MTAATPVAAIGTTAGSAQSGVAPPDVDVNVTITVRGPATTAAGLALEFYGMVPADRRRWFDIAGRERAGPADLRQADPLSNTQSARTSAVG